METQVFPALGSAGTLAGEAVLQDLGMQALFWQTQTYLIDTSSFFCVVTFCAIFLVPFFHGRRIIEVLTFKYTNKAMNWVLNIKHTVHLPQYKCTFMHAFSFHLLNCDYSAALQLIKRLQSILLSCNLELKAGPRTHLETSVISTSSIPFVHDRQPTESCSCRLKTNDFLSRKSQGRVSVALADCIQRGSTTPAYPTPISSYPLHVVLRSTLLNTRDKRKTLFLLGRRYRASCAAAHMTHIWATASFTVGPFLTFSAVQAQAPMGFVLGLFDSISRIRFVFQRSCIPSVFPALKQSIAS